MTRPTPPRAPSASALGVRGAVVVAVAVAAALIPAGGVLAVLIVIAALPAVLAPAYVGALPVLVVEVFGWLITYGVDTSAPAWRSAVFAVALYFVHVTTALAAVVELRTRVSREVLAHWFARSVPGAFGAVVVAAALALGRIGTESVAVDVVALAAAALTVGALGWLALRR